MIRSAWKLPYIDKFLYNYIEEEKKNPRNLRKSSAVAILSRNSIVKECFIDHKFGIHNGKDFFRVLITENQVGLKFGSLMLTKTIGSYMHLNNKIQKKKKERQRALKQKKLNRYKGKKKTKLKKSKRLKAKKKEWVI